MRPLGVASRLGLRPLKKYPRLGRGIIIVQRRDAELEKFTALEKRAADWQRAQVLRGYIDALAASLPSDSAETAVADQRAYIAWAREKIDWLNPLVAKTDELLGCRHPRG